VRQSYSKPKVGRFLRHGVFKNVCDGDALSVGGGRGWLAGDIFLGWPACR